MAINILKSFKSDIIDSSNYRKFKLLRLIFFGVAFTSLSAFFGDEYISGWMLELDLPKKSKIFITIFSAIAWVATAFSILYSYKTKKIGKISIGEKEIILKIKDEEKKYKTSEIEFIFLAIKGPYTKPDTIFGFRGNNWIGFDENSCFEFEIDSFSKFKTLDKIVKNVNQKRKTFHYVYEFPWSKLNQ